MLSSSRFSRPWRAVIFLTAACACVSTAAAAAQPNGKHPELGVDRPIRVGIVNYIRPSPNEPVVEATLQALRSRFGETDIQTQSYTMEELTEAIDERRVDVFLASAGFYWRTVPIGAVAIASLASRNYPNPNRGEGSAFVVRAESAYRTVGDLKGAVATVPTESGFTSFLIPMGEIQKQGFDYETFFSRVLVTGPGARSAQSIEQLDSGATDVAILRQCWLEEWVERHPEDAGRFRVLPSGRLEDTTPAPCRRSTSLYPSWVVATTPSTPPSISKAVLETIFAMPPTESGHYWSVGTDFQPIDDLYRSLRLGPYAYLREWTFERVWNEYSLPITMFLVIVLAWFMHSLRVTGLVAVRTKELTEALRREQKLKRIAADTNERLIKLQRVGIVGQISSMIAHELRQPMGALSLYTKSARRLLQKGVTDTGVLFGILDKLDAQTARANSIIEDVRSYAKGQMQVRTRTNLRAVIDEAVTAWRATGRFAQVHVVSFADFDVWFEANALEWEIVVLNLIKNAAEAAQHVDDPLVSVELEKTAPDKALLKVVDNGPILAEEQWKKLESPLETGKAEGMGLGLSIVRGIVEAHGSRLTFKRNRTRGVTAQIDVLLREPRLTVADNEEQGKCL